jgi:GNAT superfamily N-acetyltransferase
MKIKIRPARKEDSKEIIRLITELAKFEKLTPPDSKARQRLINDAFSKNPPFKILLAECDQKIAGYAFYFFTYTTFLAKRSLYLEDIYIIENFRNLNLGKLFMKKLSMLAYEKNCGRMEWIVLNWNKNAIRFYKGLGAVEMKEWKFFRITL